MFSQARFLPAAKKSGRNNEVTVRRGFTVICILKQDIPQKIFKFVDRCLRPTGRIPCIIVRPWGFSCVSFHTFLKNLPNKFAIKFSTRNITLCNKHEVSNLI